MRKHVDLLGILYMLSGGLAVLLGLSLLSLGLGAATVITSGSHDAGVAVGITAVAFIVVASTAVIWGAANMWAGAALRRHRPAARLLGLVMAVLNLFVIPFGTALGAYALWVLLNDSARVLFEARN